MKKQTEVLPYMNHGRWIFICPRCKTALMADADEVICGICHPKSRAKAMKPIEGGLFRSVPDPELTAEARREAQALGEVYVMKFPAEREQIEAMLRMRNNSKDISWDIGQSVEELIAENKQLGYPVPKGRS